MLVVVSTVEEVPYWIWYGIPQSLFALRTLRLHGLPNNALREVFQAVVINR